MSNPQRDQRFVSGLLLAVLATLAIVILVVMFA